MSIRDDTGQSSSITEGLRSLRLFTDRYDLIRIFTRALHEEDALGKILFFHGSGGNGKSLLMRFLQTYACKRFHLWDDLRQQPDAEFLRHLREEFQQEYSSDLVPVAHLDFHAPPREFEQPTVDYDALLMLRRQLGAFRATESFARLHFPVYDFAAMWYLHKTGRLTEERLRTLFPNEEINFFVQITQAIFEEIPGAEVAQAVLGLFNKHLKESWTLYQQRRRVDRALLEEIQAMDPERDLIPEMPRLFAMDLNAALTTAGVSPRIILLFDGHDAFASTSRDSTLDGDRDRWLRHLLAALDLKSGVVPVLTGRREPYWADQAQYTIPTRYLDLRLVGHFCDPDANTYLAKAGVDDPALRARLCDYARVPPKEVHPLYAGLGADVVLQATRQGRRLTAEDFPEEPDASKKQQLLVERLLMEASHDVEYAVRSLAAARAFDRELFEKLGSWGRSRYSATDAAFDTLTQFSFVWEAKTREAGWYSVHALLRRILRERGDDRLREADAALEAIYRERTEAGEPLARAEVVYHVYQQEPERGLEEWVAAFEEAMHQSQYALCDALRIVGAEFQPEDLWWQAQMTLEEGQYLLVRSRYAEADKALQASVATFDAEVQHLTLAIGESGERFSGDSRTVGGEEVSKACGDTGAEDRPSASHRAYGAEHVIFVVVGLVGVRHRSAARSVGRPPGRRPPGVGVRRVARGGARAGRSVGSVGRLVVPLHRGRKGPRRVDLQQRGQERVRRSPVPRHHQRLVAAVPELRLALGSEHRRPDRRGRGRDVLVGPEDVVPLQVRASPRIGRRRPRHAHGGGSGTGGGALGMFAAEGARVVSRASFGLQYGCSERARKRIPALPLVRRFTRKMPLSYMGDAGFADSSLLL
jgi:hypothetical protein